MTIESFFAAHGAGVDQTPRKLLWEQMLYQALLLLNEARRRVCTPESQQELRQLDGWWRNKKVKIGGTQCFVPSEEAISEALFNEMERIKEDIILKIAPADPAMAGIDTLHVCTETPRKKRTGIGRKAKPTDIRFYRAGSEILDLRIEAKVVLNESDLRRSYLSRDGLQRFSNEKEPYTTQEIGGMLAYAVTDDKAVWLSRISSALQNERPAIPAFKQKVKTIPDETLFSRVPYTVKSSTRNEVLVFHVVLEFECQPSTRS